MKERNSLEDVMLMAEAADYISLGDTLNRQLRVNQDWSLLPDIGVFSAIAPSITIKGRSMYPSFP